MQMKRFLLPLLAALALPTAAQAKISDEIHKRCLDARDYSGCVRTNQSSSASLKTLPLRFQLRGDASHEGLA